MSKLVLFEWNKVKVTDFKSKPSNGKPYSQADQALLVQPMEKVFVFGKTETIGSLDEANKQILKKSLGFQNTFKRNAMANDHVNNIDNGNSKGNKDFNDERLMAIKQTDEKFAKFFLTSLHDMVWNNYEDSIMSTINFDEALEMLKKVTKPYYDLLLASIEDKYSKDLSISAMQNVIEQHDLNVDQKLGKNLKKNKK